MTKPHVCPSELLQTDLQGKVYVVTGGNSGIGLVTVRQLAKQGATVVLACRRTAEGEKAKGAIVADGSKGKVEVEALDLGSLASVRAFAARVGQRFPRVHGLVNNAGVMNTPPGKTADGFETQFGTNHLGHFLLSELLLPNLMAGAPARVVNLSSCFHDKAQGREGKIQFDDLHFERRPYDGWESYAQSKLANLLHASEFSKLHASNGVIAVSVHPGWVRTNLVKSFMPVWVQDTIARPFLRLAGMIEPWEGAQTTLYALLAPEVDQHPGAYFSQLGMYREKSANRGGWPLRSPNPHAHDAAAAARLYAVSREAVGLASA